MERLHTFVKEVWENLRYRMECVRWFVVDLPVLVVELIVGEERE